MVRSSLGGVDFSPLQTHSDVEGSVSLEATSIRVWEAIINDYCIYLLLAIKRKQSLRFAFDDFPFLFDKLKLLSHKTKRENKKRNIVQRHSSNEEAFSLPNERHSFHSLTLCSAIRYFITSDRYEKNNKSNVLKSKVSLN